jgi:hypothetical protein
MHTSGWKTHSYQKQGKANTLLYQLHEQGENEENRMVKHMLSLSLGAVPIGCG